MHVVHMWNISISRKYSIGNISGACAIPSTISISYLSNQLVTICVVSALACTAFRKTISDLALIIINPAYIIIAPLYT